MPRMARNVTQDIWRAVVFSGAMLGAGVGCASTPKAQTTPVRSPAPSPTPVVSAPPEPSAPPVVEEPRPRADDDERVDGRGFVIA
jgi:hypothetical protein